MNEMIDLRDRLAEFLANQQCINGFYIQALTIDENETDEYIGKMELFFIGFRLTFTIPKSIYLTVPTCTFYIKTTVTGIDGMYLGKVAFLANQTAESIKEVFLRRILDEVYIYPPIKA